MKEGEEEGKREEEGGLLRRKYLCVYFELMRDSFEEPPPRR
jgi:hypothetical protein